MEISFHEVPLPLQPETKAAMVLSKLAALEFNLNP